MARAEAWVAPVGPAAVLACEALRAAGRVRGQNEVQVANSLSRSRLPLPPLRLVLQLCSVSFLLSKKTISLFRFVVFAEAVFIVFSIHCHEHTP